MRPVLAAVLVALAAGCGAEGEKPAGTASPADVPKLEAAELYRDYSTLSGSERLKRYAAGVQVAGTVKEVIDLGGDEGHQLHLAATAPGHIAVKFRDRGAAAARLKLQPGEPVTLFCQLNGKPDDILFLVDCELRETR